MFPEAEALLLRSPALWARAAKLSEEVDLPPLACNVSDQQGYRTATDHGDRYLGRLDTAGIFFGHIPLTRHGA